MNVMDKFKFELNRAGVRELLKSNEMMRVCEERAIEIKNRCPDGYEISKHTGKNRVNVSVHPATEAAMRDNYQNNTLLKARGAK